MELLNPIGISTETGELITIYDLEESSRGLGCKCICPNCKGAFKANMGDIRQWHFAHAGTPCNKMMQMVTSEFMPARQIFMSGEPFFFPGLADYFKDGSFIPKQVDVIINNRGIPEAILIDDQLAIRLELEIDYCVDTISKKYKDISTLSIDCKNNTGLNYSQRMEKILRDIHNKRWIYSSRVERIKAQTKAIVAPVDIDEADEEVKSELKRKTYDQRTVKCVHCGKVVHKDDAMWGTKTGGYYCHKCLDNELGWSNV